VSEYETLVQEMHDRLEGRVHDAQAAHLAHLAHAHDVRERHGGRRLRIELSHAWAHLAGAGHRVVHHGH
jgi:hypothetical protein